MTHGDQLSKRVSVIGAERTKLLAKLLVEECGRSLSGDEIYRSRKSSDVWWLGKVRVVMEMMKM